MAEAFEFEIKPKGIDSTVRELRQLEGQLNDVGGSMDGAGASSSNMAQNITAGVVAAQAAYAAISRLATAVGAAADEFERQSGILNRFTGDITEASARTNGLISQLDLMTAQSRAAAAGLTLTGDQFATVSVRASEFAARTGGDATQALNSLIGAIATGRAGQLLQYGVDLQGITEITDKQTAALAGLTEGYEDAESSADTLGGRLAVLETEFDNIQTEIIQVVNDSGLLESAWDNLTSATTMLIGEFSVFGDSNGPISDLEMFVITGVAAINAFSQQMEAAAGAFTAFFDLIADPDNNEAMGRMAESMDNLGAVAFNRQVEEGQAAGVVSSFTERNRRQMAGREAGATRPTRGRSRGSRNAGDADSPEVDTSAQDEITRLIEEQLALETQLLDNNADKAAIAGELAKTERERLELMAQQTEQALAQKQALNDAFEAEQSRNDLMSKSKRVQDGVTQGLEGIASVTKRTIALTEDGAMSTKEAFKTALDEWLKQLAIQEAWKGAAATVEAIGLAFTNPPAAGSKVAEAAGHFAIAAAAGGASAAIPNAGGGGGGGEATRPADASPGAGTTDGGNITIQYNSPTAESQLGRMQARASRAADRVFE